MKQALILKNDGSYKVTEFLAKLKQHSSKRYFKVTSNFVVPTKWWISLPKEELVYLYTRGAVGKAYYLRNPSSNPQKVQFFSNRCSTLKIIHSMFF